MPMLVGGDFRNEGGIVLQFSGDAAKLSPENPQSPRPAEERVGLPEDRVQRSLRVLPSYPARPGKAGAGPPAPWPVSVKHSRLLAQSHRKETV